MKKHGDELKKDTGKWIDSSVWHGKAHTWDKIKWLIKEVRVTHASMLRDITELFLIVEVHLWR